MSAIRPYRPSDREAVDEICVRTGASGTDATGLYSDDSLLPDIFAEPYLAYQPELAFVVDTGDHVAGYVIGVSDTAAFADWYKREWRAGFAERHPLDTAATDAERELIRYGLSYGDRLVPELGDYPAHLHIDLLPELQGQGFGRRLIRRLLAELEERGVSAVHLGVSATNTSARAFYNRLGFHELPSSTPEGPSLGIATDALI
ncbi:GNAT family N-acetyltransferase [Leifsonia sp. NPDC058230]|uniref:GNAT family N-acetyltransferase n=1 Tax=Leifsonia sp. NPDC058230 TaxID=3346391 RepID=UPI0036DF3505